jgi:hypothetical protein
MSSLSEVYKNFLLTLVNTKCLYSGENETDEYPLRRQEKLLSFCESIMEITDELLLKYINYINDMISIMKEKKNIKVSDTNFFNLFWKVIDKKSNKSSNFFFLTNNKEKTSIHIALIISNTSKENINNIQNYILMMYIQACNLLYTDINTSSNITQLIYNEIIELFENPQEDNNFSDIQSELKSIISSVLPENQYGSSVSNIMNNQKFDKIFSGVINSVCPPDKINDLRNELHNTNRDELINKVKDIKERISSINISELMNNMNQSGLFEKVAQSMENNNNNLNMNDFKNIAESFAKDKNLESLFNTVKTEVTESTEEIKELDNDIKTEENIDVD